MIVWRLHLLHRTGVSVYGIGARDPEIVTVHPMPLRTPSENTRFR